MSRAALVVALVCAAAGCKDDDSKAPAGGTAGSGERAAGAEDATPAVPQAHRIVLTGVHVVSEGEGEPIDRDALASEMRALLTASEWFFADASELPAGVAPREARLDVRVTHGVASEGLDGRPALLTAVEASVAWVDRSEDLAPAENVAVEAPVPDGGPSKVNDAIATKAREAARLAARGLIAREAVRSGPRARRLDVIEHGEPDLAQWALEVVRERRETAAYDAVVRYLQRAQGPRRGTPVGVLVALGDPRAVDVLTESAAFDDHDYMRVIIEAVSVLGGEDAEVYLEFVASGHPDDDIRERATEALERVRE